MGFLGFYGVTIGTILGSVAIALSSIGSGHILDKWIIAGAGTALVGLCAAADTADQLRALKLRSELEKDVQAYATLADTKRGFVAFLNGRLHDCLNRPVVDVDHCDDLESLLERIDEANGGVPFYRAEILRNRGRIQDSDDQLYNYLEADRRLRPAGDDDGEAAICTTNGTGYCRQRTAWICHTLANDLFRRGCEAAGTSSRRDWFARAWKQMECVDKWFESGFEQRLGTRPLNTVDLRVALDLQLKDPSRKCDAAPKR